MHYFFSVGEPSGDVHGSHLIEELQRLDPSAKVTGFGGPLMAQAGAKLHYSLVDNPIFGVRAAVRAIPFLRKLLADTTATWQTNRPDAVILIDYPGFNWHVAKAAKKAGIKVFYYVPPQIWAWATWRVHKMRRLIDHVFCSLPFEETWLKEHGIANAEYVGHPFFDELSTQQLDETFLAQERAKPGVRIALLPGSRSSEVNMNFAMMVKSAERIFEVHPKTRFLIAGFKQKQQALMQPILDKSHAPIDLHFGKTPEIMSLAHASITVSGSVSLELMHRQVPTAIVYRISKIWHHAAKFVMRSKHITLVNLLADKRVFPEFLVSNDASEEIAQQIITWLDRPTERERVLLELRKLNQKFGQPGAGRRAAEQIVRLLRSTEQSSTTTSNPTAA